MQIVVKTADVELTGVSLFPYVGEVRQHILGAKVKHSIDAINSIASVIQSLKLSGRVFIPAPSSLRSKCFLRFDVALFMAVNLQRTLAAELILPPYKTQFHFGKQTSQRNRIADRIYLRPHFGTLQSECPFLVDDVLTSGQTLISLARSMSFSRANFVTYAYAESVLSNF